MEERHFSTLVSLLGEDVLSDDCLVVVTGGNDDKNQNQNQQFEKGDNNPHCNNCHCIIAIVKCHQSLSKIGTTM